MKHICAISLFCAAALLSGCGGGTKEEKLVSDFLKENLRDNDIKNCRFSDIDSTSHVADSAIIAMRADTERTNAFKKGIKYAERSKGEKLRFISVSYKKADGEKAKHTFYVDNKGENVVCLKTDAVEKDSTARGV